jgi:hypothetical protein
MTELKDQSTDDKTYFKLGQIAYENFGVCKTVSTDNNTGRTRTSMWLYLPKSGENWGEDCEHIGCLSKSLALQYVHCSYKRWESASLFILRISWIVTLSSIPINNQLDTQFLLYIFISILYMFRATLCSSSGESILSIQHLVYVTLCRWPSGMQVG